MIACRLVLWGSSVYCSHKKSLCSLFVSIGEDSGAASSLRRIVGWSRVSVAVVVTEAAMIVQWQVLLDLQVIRASVVVERRYESKGRSGFAVESPDSSPQNCWRRRTCPAARGSTRPIKRATCFDSGTRPKPWGSHGSELDL